MLRGRAGALALVPPVEPVGLTPLIDLGDAVPLVRQTLRSRTNATRQQHAAGGRVLGRQPVLTYCSANNSYHTYHLPRSVGLLPEPPNLTKVNLSWIPVVHTRDAYPISFFHFAAGCSDLYIRPTKHMLALNRVDALFRLAPRKAYEHLRFHCHPSESLKAIHHVLSTPLLAAHRKVPRPIAMLSGSGCLNLILYTLLESGGFDTLLLNDEFSGDGLHRKAEVMQVHDAPLYDANGFECDFNRSMVCLHCGDRTPRTRLTCGE